MDDTLPFLVPPNWILLQSSSQAHRPSFEGKAPERGHWKMQRTGKGKTIIGKLAKYDQRKVKLVFWTNIFNNIFAPALIGKEVNDGKVEVRSVQLPIKFLVLEDHLQFKNGITDACSTADCLVNLVERMKR